MSSRTAQTVFRLARRHRHHQGPSAVSSPLQASRPSLLASSNHTTRHPDHNLQFIVPTGYSSNRKLRAFTTTAFRSRETFPASKIASTPSKSPDPNMSSPPAPKKAKMDEGIPQPNDVNNDDNNGDMDNNNNDPNHGKSASGLAKGEREHDLTETIEHEEAAKHKAGQEWRGQPPYSTAEEGFHKRHEAQCHCGRIRYWLSREAPLGSKFCHCKDCQSLHGAPFQWAAIFQKTDIHFEHGSRGLAFYDSAHKHTKKSLPTKVSCAYCHAPIMDEGRNMVLLFPAIIKWKSVEDKKRFDPTMHIFYDRRVVDILDGKPKWSGIDEKSEISKDQD